MTTNDNDPASQGDEVPPVVPPLPPGAFPDANGAAAAPSPDAGTYGPPAAGGYGSTAPGNYGPPAAGSYGPPAPGNYGPPPGGYPYGSDGSYQPGMMPPPVQDNRPGLWWGILGGALVIGLCVLFFGLSEGGGSSGAWFAGVTMSFAVVPLVATILVVPFQTRKIGQGMFIVLGAIPLLWFGVCVQAMTAH